MHMYTHIPTGMPMTRLVNWLHQIVADELNMHWAFTGAGAILLSWLVRGTMGVQIATAIVIVTISIVIILHQHYLRHPHHQVDGLGIVICGENQHSS